MQDLKGNKGEWSEIFVLLQLLANGELLLKRGKNSGEGKFIIRSITKQHKSGENKEYCRHGDQIDVIKSGRILSSVKINDVRNMAEELLRQMKAGEGSFHVSGSLEEELRGMLIDNVKASPVAKNDIFITVADRYSDAQSTLGFSIKSKVGGASTLLNASRATNFRYTIIDNNRKAENYFKNKSVVGDIRSIVSDGNNSEFSGCISNNFYSNLLFIDSNMPSILAAMVREYYMHGSKSLVKDLTNFVAKIDPCGYSGKSKLRIYESKIQSFLEAVALGMRPDNTWTGSYEVNGGYLILEKNGSIDCISFNDRNSLRLYLFENSKLDTPSSTKHDYRIVKRREDTSLYIDLCLQIRFTS